MPRKPPARPRPSPSRQPPAELVEGRGSKSGSVRDLVDEGAQALEAAGVSFGHGTTNALDESAWLLLHTLKLPYGALNEHLEDRPSTARVAVFRALVRKRISTRKPAAYLLNEAWLGVHRFYVDERVIVPRSFIAELLPKLGFKPFSILDLCTGSGCLAIVIALAHPKARVDATDLSADALEVAKRNVADYDLGRRVRLVESDLFSALGGRVYDLIVSNPPYVKAAAMRKLPAEYRKEPKIALASGDDGLEHARKIIGRAKRHLNPGGLLVVEIGHNRTALQKAFPRLPFRWPKVSAGGGFVFTLRREDL